jgi:nucleoside 2-deoxyribosyltransferase
MRVYISGKIGEEVLSEATRQKFAKAEEYLRSWDFEVFNPTTSGLGERAEEPARQNGTDFYTEIMKLDLAELEWCDAIYMLTDWTDSPGAKRELSQAKELGLAIWHENV